MGAQGDNDFNGQGQQAYILQGETNRYLLSSESPRG